MIPGFSLCFFPYFSLNFPLLLIGPGHQLNEALHPVGGLPAHLLCGVGADVQRKGSGGVTPIETNRKTYTVNRPTDLPGFFFRQIPAKSRYRKDCRTVRRAIRGKKLGPGATAQSLGESPQYASGNQKGYSDAMLACKMKSSLYRIWHGTKNS